MFSIYRYSYFLFPGEPSTYTGLSLHEDRNETSSVQCRFKKNRITRQRLTVQNDGLPDTADEKTLSDATSVSKVTKVNSAGSLYKAKQNGVDADSYSRSEQRVRGIGVQGDQMKQGLGGYHLQVAPREAIGGDEEDINDDALRGNDAITSENIIYGHLRRENEEERTTTSATSTTSATTCATTCTTTCATSATSSPERHCWARGTSLRDSDPPAEGSSKGGQQQRSPRIGYSLVSYTHERHSASLRYSTNYSCSLEAGEPRQDGRQLSNDAKLINSKFLEETRGQKKKQLSCVIRKNNSKKSLRNKKRIIRMLTVVVLEFFFCWTPLYVMNTVSLFDPQSVYSFLGMGGVSVVQLLAYCSACCNPITYCFMNKSFRTAFYAAVQCRGPTSYPPVSSVLRRSASLHQPPTNQQTISASKNGSALILK